MNRRLLYGAVVAAMTATAIGVTSGSATAARPSGPNAAPTMRTATNVCANTFPSGSGATAQSFCVTANGNLGALSWHGDEQIRLGNFTEGYALCVGGTLQAYDFEDFGESGFQAPTFSQPGGPNTLPLKITRVTSDGKYSLTQSFATSLGSVTVTMVVKNASGATANNVRYLRLADLDDAATFSEEFARTTDSVSAHVENGTGTIMTTSSYANPHAVYALTTIPFTCAPTSDSTPETVDGVGLQSFDFSSIKNGRTKTVNTIYRRF